MIGLMMMLAAASLNTATQADLVCAEVTAREMMSTAEGSKERMGSNVAHFYYLGRLSVRDSGVDWVARIVSDVEANPKGDDVDGRMLGTCLGIVNGHLASGLP